MPLAIPPASIHKYPFAPNAYWAQVTNHEAYRLNQILIYSERASTYELVRGYNLSYAASTASLQTDDYSGQKVLTLTGIERLDQNGQILYLPGTPSPRPFLTSFGYYTDPGANTDTRPAGFNRLATIDNGQGGKLTFTYEHAFAKNSVDPAYAPPTSEWWLYRNIYRVTQALAQDLTGTGKSALTAYSYQNPAVNDYNHAATVIYAQYPPTGNGDSRQWLARAEKREFRGHAYVIERHYDGATTAAVLLQETRHRFYQGGAGCLPTITNSMVSETDACFIQLVQQESWKGKEYQTAVWNAGGSNPLQLTAHTFGRTELPFYGDASTAGASNHYKRVGLWRAFNPEIQTLVQTYEGGGTAVDKKTIYAYDQSGYQSGGPYGNLTSQAEYNGTTLMRTTEHFYDSLNTATSYLVDRRWADDTRDGANRLLALTHYFYDSQNTTANAVGTKGDLTRVAKYYDVPLAASAQNMTLHGQDTTFTYDVYGNRLTETTYAQAGTRLLSGTTWTISAPGAGSAARTAPPGTTRSFTRSQLASVTR